MNVLGRWPIALLVGICAPLLVVGMMFNRRVPAGLQFSGAFTADLAAHAQLVEVRDRQDETVLSGEFRARTDAVGNLEKDAALLDRRGNKGIGEVELEVPARGRRDRRPELEVDIIGLPAGETFALVIDNQVVARFTVDDRGSIDRELLEGEVPSSVGTSGQLSD